METLNPFGRLAVKALIAFFLAVVGIGFWYALSSDGNEDPATVILDVNPPNVEPVPEFNFDPPGRDKAVGNTEVKPIEIQFKAGSHELTKSATATIDEGMVPFINTIDSAYLEIGGNTDSEGNPVLFKRRADVVVDYLVDEWEYSRDRFTVVGKGPDKLLCDGNTLPSDTTLEECKARNHTTRVAVLTTEN